MRILGRISPANEARLFEPKVLGPLPPRKELVAQRFEPMGKAQVGNSGEMSLRIESPLDFAMKYQATKDKGFWMMMNPNPADQRLATGHATIIIGDFVFNRLSDDLGQQAMRAIHVDEVAGLFMHSRETPYLVTQFFEVSPQSLETLKKFFHDRVWNYHMPEAEWRTTYERLPLSAENKDKPKCENCSLFSWSFLDPRWADLVPELRAVQQEVGSVVVDQIPIQQLFNNSQNRAYRGTVLIAKDAAQTEEFLKKGIFSDDVVGAQTLFHDFKATP